MILETIKPLGAHQLFERASELGRIVRVRIWHPTSVMVSAVCHG